MASKKSFDPEGQITTVQAAEMLGITPARLRQLVAEGHVAKTGRGMTTPAMAARGYAKFFQDLAGKQTKTSADSRVRDARAKEIEMRVAKEERSLIPLDEAQETLELFAATFRDAVAGLPTRITRDLVDRQKLETEVHAVLNKIADAFEASARDLREGIDDPSGSDEDDA